MNNKFSSKSGHQLLPKHMRRRQMSHNPFRIPIRARINNLNVNVKSKCKKHKKKKMYLKTSLIRRARKQNWLETHIWHSKRFTMGKSFGYTIAEKRRDKGFKACFKYAKYYSCVYDASYFNFIFIENFIEEKNLEIFQKIILNFTIDKFNKIEFNKLYEVKLYDESRLIGPVHIILLNKGMIIKFHPLL